MPSSAVVKLPVHWLLSQRLIRQAFSRASRCIHQTLPVKLWASLAAPAGSLQEDRFYTSKL